MLSIHTPAPIFDFVNQHGENVNLKDIIGKKMIVIYFYPKDFTPGCTAQACTFRDAYEDLVDLGAEVIGVSADSSESHARFSAQYALPYHLVSDKDGRIRRLYDISTGIIGVLFSRITYIIDLSGKIAWAYKSNLSPASHIAEAKNALKKINSAPGRSEDDHVQVFPYS
ncbi:MAG: peroxiredoxin [Thermaurantimonas sp.]